MTRALPFTLSMLALFVAGCATPPASQAENQFLDNYTSHFHPNTIGVQLALESAADLYTTGTRFTVRFDGPVPVERAGLTIPENVQILEGESYHYYLNNESAGVMSGSFNGTVRALDISPLTLRGWAATEYNDNGHYTGFQNLDVTPTTAQPNNQPTTDSLSISIDLANGSKRQHDIRVSTSAGGLASIGIEIFQGERQLKGGIHWHKLIEANKSYRLPTYFDLKKDGEYCIELTILMDVATSDQMKQATACARLEDGELHPT